MSAENKKFEETKTSVITETTSVKPALSTERASAVFNEVSQLVGGAEAISVAQAKIKELESERDQLRSEVDKLKVSFEALERSSRQLQDQLDQVNKKHREKIEIQEDEKAVLRERLSAKEKEVLQLTKKAEDLQWRFESDLLKVRVKEREYENKNIVIKAEAIAVAKSKDEMILDLKAQVDQLHFEINQFKNRIKENDKIQKELEERQTKALKALRVSMGILENEITEVKLKKVSGDD